MLAETDTQFKNEFNRETKPPRHYLQYWAFFSLNSSPINAKKVNTTTSSDSYIGLWRNYLILCCSAASSSSSSTSTGSVRCSPPETLASTPDSGYSIDSRVGSSNDCCKYCSYYWSRTTWGLWQLSWFFKGCVIYLKICLKCLFSFVLDKVQVVSSRPYDKGISTCGFSDKF